MLAYLGNRAAARPNCGRGEAFEAIALAFDPTQPVPYLKRSQEGFQAWPA